MDSIIEAIKTKKIIEFHYDGLFRYAEPHVYGRINGKLFLLTFQLKGQTKTGGLPEWRLFEMQLISDIKITDISFPGKREATGRHKIQDVIAMVD